MPDAPTTLRDIARRSGVSIGTVSRVLHHHPDVHKDLRQRVLDTVAALNYVAPTKQHGGAVSATTLRQVAFLLARTSAVENAQDGGPFWADILHGVESQARLIGCQVHFRVIALDEDADLLAHQLREARLDGILLVGAADPAIIAALHDPRLPLVLVDHTAAGWSGTTARFGAAGLALDAVLADNFGGMALAMRYLLDRGHRRIAFLGGTAPGALAPSRAFHTVDLRLAAYRHTLLSAGLVVDPALHLSCEPNAAGGEAAMQRLIASGADFTAIACANDKTAIGALKALHAAGIRVPDEVSLIGFDDGELADLAIPGLTTVHVDAQALGSTAFRVLQGRAQASGQLPLTITLGVTLTERASVRDLNAANSEEYPRP